MRSRFIILLMLSFFFSNVKGQIHITGTVIDSSTKKPVEAVLVMVKETKTGTYTDENGKFNIELKKDAAILVFTSLGYEAKEVSVNTKENVYEIGIIQLQDFHRQYLENRRDTIKLNDLFGDRIVIIKINNVTAQVVYSDLIHFLDSIVVHMGNYRKKDMDYGVSYIKNKIEKSSQVNLDKQFIKRVGMTVIERFLVSMVEDGNVALYNEKNEKQTEVIRIKTGFFGKDKCSDCCWFGRKFYLPGHKINFLIITDAIC